MWPRYELLAEGMTRDLGPLWQDVNTYPAREPYQSIDRCKILILNYSSVDWNAWPYV